VPISATSTVAQAESLADAGPADAKYVPQIAESCEKLGELVADRSPARTPAGPRRRSLHRSGNRGRRLRDFSAIEQKSACSGSTPTPI
jgi:hypothetical protein